MAFNHQITARFHEVDRGGVVFFGRYFDYAHQTFEAFIDAALDGPSPFDGTDWGVPLVHVEADYRRPIRRGDALIVELTVQRWSQRSVTFTHRIRGADDPSDLRATILLKHVFVAWPDFAPAQRPAAFEAACHREGLITEQTTQA